MGNLTNFTAIGAISGTSMDAIDVSIVETDGREHVIPGPGRSYPYEPALRATLLKLIAAPEIAETDPLTALEEAVTDAHVAAIQRFILETGLDRDKIDLVGMHGQTVYHRPEKRFTRQFCLGARAAKMLGLAKGAGVVARFRHADVAAGGEGAPFAPLYHRALAAKLPQPVMVLNLGGVGNVTYMDGETVIAFDTGPASALLDDFVLRRTGKPFDDCGALAATGKVDHQMVAGWMHNPFFDRPAPKSLDRQDFHARARNVEQLSDADGAATLTDFTISATIDALRHVPTAPKRWLVTGGGRLNQTYLRLLRDRLGVSVEAVEAVGWQGDFIEAQCFGYLAARSRLGLPLSLPTTTGAPEPMTGGEFWAAA